MDRSKYDKKAQHSMINILFWAVGILLLLTLISVHLVSGTFAKYVIGGDYSDSAHVASMDGQLVLLEHRANLENGEYKLDETEEVTENKYNFVIPGVDIAKDPFIKLDIDTEGTYELYIKVLESDSFPSTVTYSLTADWELVDAENGVYKYKSVFSTNTSDTIKILKNDKLYVSEHYVGNSQEFTLSFRAWLVQTGIE